MSLSIVKCSKAYEKVVLYDDSGRLQPPAGLANQDSEDNTRVTSTSLVEAYVTRTQQENWAHESEFFEHQEAMETTNLATFCVKFHVYKKGQNRNKIHRRQQSAKEVVIQFHPSRLSALPTSPNYVEYCRYSLMKYKPWNEHPKNTYDGIEDVPTEEDATIIKATWENFISLEGNEYVPEWFFRELDNLQADQHHQLFHQLQHDPNAVPTSAHQLHPPDGGFQ